jgi:hypothetical protein
MWKNNAQNLNLPENEVNDENTNQSSAVINAYNELEVFDQELGNTDTNIEVNVDTLQ